MRIVIAAALLVACQVFPAKAAGTGDGPMFPSELHGVWDAYPWPCVDDGPSDSDMRFAIDGNVRGNYEDIDTLVSIEEIATAPRTWRVVATTSLDPTDVEGDARIYVLQGNTLAVTDGRRADVYVRCR